jgi:hypothetical protein
LNGQGTRQREEERLHEPAAAGITVAFPQAYIAPSDVTAVMTNIATRGGFVIESISEEWCGYRGR